VTLIVIYNDHVAYWM